MVWGPFSGEPTTKDFFTEVGLGNIPGFRLEGFQMEGEIDTILGDVWGGTGDLIYPDAPVSLRIKSDNDADNSTGTGMRTAVVISLNASKLLTITPVILDGQNFVDVAGTHIRPHIVAGVDSGSNESNIGSITLSETVSGNVWNVIVPGVGISHDGHFTVPSSETGQFLNLYVASPKDNNLSGATAIRDGESLDSTWLRSVNLYSYQSLIQFQILAKLPLDPESDVKVIAKAGSGVFIGTFIFELLYKTI